VLLAKVRAALGVKGLRDRLFKQSVLVETVKRELQNIIDSLSARIYVVDRDRRILRLNRPALKHLGGESFEQVLGRTIPDVSHRSSAYRSEIESFRKRVFEKGELVNEELETEKDGKRNWINVKMFPMSDDEGVIDRCISVFEDITAWKLLQEQEMKAGQAEAVSHLAGAFSHAMNQPLGAIVARAELLMANLERGRLTDELIMRDIKEILSCCKEVESLIRKFHNVKDYVTQPYVGTSEILDIEKAAKESND